MWAILNEQIFIDRQSIQPESWNHARAEKSGPGTDGVISIPLGRRSRRLFQAGTLRAQSRPALDNLVSRIESLAGTGDISLRTERGRTYRDLRIDTFQTGIALYAGTGFLCDFNIEYTQLERNETE